jgi:hypothetical protein
VSLRENCRVGTSSPLNAHSHCTVAGVHSCAVPAVLQPCLFPPEAWLSPLLSSGFSLPAGAPQIDGKRVLNFASAYGFRNIQNLVRKVKLGKCEYHFVEIMACPSGCLNGGGQIKPRKGQTTKDLIQSLEAAYLQEVSYFALDPHHCFLRALGPLWTRFECCRRLISEPGSQSPSSWGPPAGWRCLRVRAAKFVKAVDKSFLRVTWQGVRFRADPQMRRICRVFAGYDS